MKCMPENNDRVNVDNQSGAGENAVNPAEVQRLQKMGEKIHLVLRMAAMDMLEETAGLEKGAALFAAYEALEEKCSGDWSALERVVDPLWTQEAIHMVLDSEKYIAVWRELRLRVITQALSMLKMDSGDEAKKMESRYFTLISLHICDNVLDTLSRSDEKKC